MNIWTLYTGFALILALALLYRLFRCAHAWELVDKTEFCSQLEEVAKHGHHFTECRGTAVDAAAKRVAVIVMRCPKCGAAKIVRIES
jgi:predicted RNA-binding Zn-ribbon protein involved in translation (DUF1610 family)